MTDMPEWTVRDVIAALQDRRIQFAVRDLVALQAAARERQALEAQLTFWGERE